MQASSRILTQTCWLGCKGSWSARRLYLHVRDIQGSLASLVFEPGHLYLTQVMVIMNMALQYFWQDLLLQSWLVRDIDWSLTDPILHVISF